MNTQNILIFNRWLIRQLINALLRPMFVRWKASVYDLESKYTNLHRPAQADRYELLFWHMLDRCDCFPFRIEVDRCGFWILDEPSEYYLGEEYPL